MELNQNGRAKQPEIEINQYNNTSDEKHSPDESRSTETAGPIRGFFRALSSRFSIGRLPTKIPKPPNTSLPTPTIPKNIPRPNPVKIKSSLQRLVRQRRGARIAKVSDAASTGLDAVSSVNQNQEDTGGKDHHMKHSNKKEWNWRGTMTKSFHFAGSFVQNSILGTAVFEAYEYALFKLIPQKYPMKEIDNSSQNLQNITYSKTSLIQQSKPNLPTILVPYHFLAGGIAGMTHGILSTAFDSLQTVFSNRHSLRQSVTLTSFSIHQKTFKSITHHSISHAILFGSYEFWKQTFSSSLATTFFERYTNEEDRNNTSKKGEYQYGEWGHIAGVMMAGGIAGSSQNFISHYTEYFLVHGHSISPSDDTKLKKKARFLLPRIFPSHFPSGPSLRHVLLAFSPTAIGFIAFEYGKEISS